MAELRFIKPDPNNPLRVCGRCGVERKDAKREHIDCIHWGVTYDHHVWVWWPDSKETADG